MYVEIVNIPQRRCYLTDRPYVRKLYQNRHELSQTRQDVVIMQTGLLYESRHELSQTRQDVIIL